MRSRPLFQRGDEVAMPVWLANNEPFFFIWRGTVVVFRRATCHQMRCQPRGEGTGKGRGDGSVSEGRLGRGRCTRTSLGAVQTVRGWLSDLGMSPAQLERRDRKKEEREREDNQASRSQIERKTLALATIHPRSCLYKRLQRLKKY